MNTTFLSWDVSPTIIDIGPLAVRWYGLLFALAFLQGYLFMRWVYRREQQNTRELDNLLVILVISAVAGARLAYCFFYDPHYYQANPLEILKIWKGGLASHGGVAAMAIALFLFSKNTTRNAFLWYLDRLIIPGVLGGALIRLGNFFNSEIVGTPTDLPWAVIFKRYGPLPRHPVQLYESISYVCIFVLLFSLYKTKESSLHKGQLTGAGLTLVFSARFLLEFVKSQQETFALPVPFSMGQLLSLPVIGLGIFLILWKGKDSSHRSIN